MKKSKQLCTPQELLNSGLDPAVIWNVDRNKVIKSSIFIVSALKNGYSNQVISTLANYFGKEMILESLESYKDRVSHKLFTTVSNYLNNTKLVA
jgi:hypothetical protein